MTDNEIIAALRCCYALVGTAVECEKCQYYVCEQLCGELSKKLGRKTWTSCDIGGVCMDAANRIERLTAERGAALADLADARSCKTCKYACDTRDCSSCKSKTCKCLKCSLDKVAWEWRGLPEAPEEGEKA